MIILCLLGTLALFLTVAMFAVKSYMLGFPCGIFWALFGSQAYILSTAVWDIEYFIFFSSMGMLIFCIFAAYGLRTRKEDIIEGGEYIDEGREDLEYVGDSSKSTSKDAIDIDDDEDKPRKSSREIRERAVRRRARWD